VNLYDVWLKQMSSTRVRPASTTCFSLHRYLRSWMSFSTCFISPCCRLVIVLTNLDDSWLIRMVDWNENNNLQKLNNFYVFWPRKLGSTHHFCFNFNKTSCTFQSMESGGYKDKWILSLICYHFLIGTYCRFWRGGYSTLPNKIEWTIDMFYSC
jgi:hypothetical protein